MFNAYIKGVGHFLPDRVVTNKDLEALMDTSDEWIQERTGIRERRWVEKGDGNSTSSMGVKAARKAIENAGLQPSDIDFLIFATLSPDYYFPGSGVLAQRELGLDTIGALDVRNQCSGFIYSLAIANQFIKTGTYKNILVIGSELHSGALEKTTRGRGVTVIFGDGAGAVVVSATEENKGIQATCMHSEGEHAEELAIIGPATHRWVDEILEANDPDDTSWRAYMNGNFVFKHAITRMKESIEEVLSATNHTSRDIDLLIPHQANLRIAQMVQRSLGLGDEQVYNNIMRYGNTTAGSIPIALSEALQEGKLKEGDLLCLTAFGSGFTWGAATIIW
jgi:3-oxoacyl-[acyl-carrier-protein] synthase-3